METNEEYVNRHATKKLNEAADIMDIFELCRHSLATNSRGETIPLYHPQVSHICMSGALAKAGCFSGLVSKYMYKKLDKVLNGKTPFFFNDYVAKDKAEVVAKLREAANVTL